MTVSALLPNDYVHSPQTKEQTISDDPQDAAKTADLLAVIEKIAAMPLPGERVEDGVLRMAYIEEGLYDKERDVYAPTAFAESAFLTVAVTDARGARKFRSRT